jgi:hypothetical protein
MLSLKRDRERDVKDEDEVSLYKVSKWGDREGKFVGENESWRYGCPRPRKDVEIDDNVQACGCRISVVVPQSKICLIMV